MPAVRPLVRLPLSQRSGMRWLVACLVGMLGAGVAAQSFPISDPERSLMVRDITVVDDAARTQDPCLSTSTPDANKKWTAGYLITEMANQPATGKTPSRFAKEWLGRWNTATTVNGDPVIPISPYYSGFTSDPATAQTSPGVILKRWLKASGATPGNPDPSLMMNKTPMRLLAIVNRADLRDNPQNKTFAAGKVAELRFVFQVVNVSGEEGATFTQPNGTCNGMAATHLFTGSNNLRGHFVIFEYGVFKSNAASARAYIQKWHSLTSMPMGAGATAAENAAYMTKLQELTESVVVRGAGGSRPNGSNLLRIRTSETPDFTMYDFREFVIGSTQKSPIINTVDRTPALAFNNSSDLRTWALNNKTAILAGTHSIPATLPGTNKPFRGGHAFGGSFSRENRTPQQEGMDLWKIGALTTNEQKDIRHKLALATCSGCHRAETVSPETAPDLAHTFYHVSARNVGQASRLSSYLTGTLLSGGDFYKEDPAVPGLFRSMNELYVRQIDMQQLLNSSSGF